ncbi:MAG: LytTR family DNA-binding domain-containing protein [Bryobacteraceae bacterium]
MIRAVVVDDEPPARRKLRHLISAEPNFTVVGEAGSGAEAVDLLNRLQPDLAFLDVQLPDCSGFDVLESVENRDRLHVIFVTAYDDFALKAFEIHALDYLLKPVEPSRFARAAARLRSVLESASANHMASRLDELVASLRSQQTYVRRLLIQENARSVFLEVSRIDWIEAARNYACIHSGARTYILRSSLESLSAKLDPAIFRRINRSEIVNVDRIAEVRPWFHGDQKIRLKDGKELNWSRRYRADSLEELERA